MCGPNGRYGLPLPNTEETLKGTVNRGQTIYHSNPVTAIGQEQNRAAEAQKHLDKVPFQREMFGGGPEHNYGFMNMGVSDERYLDEVRRKAYAEQEAKSLGEYLKNGGGFESMRFQNFPGGK